jgi:hypothetical protein
MIEVLKEAADYDPAVKLGLEYKFKERVHNFISTVASRCCARRCSDQCGRDSGQAAILAYENAAESFALTSCSAISLFCCTSMIRGLTGTAPQRRRCALPGYAGMALLG